MNLAEIYENNLFLTNLFEFLDIKSNVVESKDAIQLEYPIQSGISFENVSFQYSEGGKQVLQDINLTINPGEIVAIVGANGSGKSTLVKLLCRLYDPTNGKITYNGKPLRDYKISDLRREISVMFQDYSNYYLSVKNNIWFGRVKSSLDIKG